MQLNLGSSELSLLGSLEAHMAELLKALSGCFLVRCSDLTDTLRCLPPLDAQHVLGDFPGDCVFGAAPIPPRPCSDDMLCIGLPVGA